MIDFIQGKLISNKSTEIVVATNGIGYQLKVSLNTARHLPAVGEEVSLRTYLHVRENQIQLFGFAEEQERELFLGLLSISGIGPKLALTLLSGLSVEQINQAIVQQDTTTLASISGIGRKTAQRLIIELKDRVSMSDLPTQADTSKLPMQALMQEAVLALVSLGYSRSQAEKAVKKVQAAERVERSEELIRKALQII